ncbi:hypothetical protein SD70_30495 [Gordoniibacillus kamchatkensis]|uniref:Uncharacterized protein n=1 Tax=Gordoniibacillus kamchatkensis TaxID=1590651 RepID=A0ABR5AA84_9BACL|nr:hypothetical protein [Paenibacillus sp. VKM B-2647]KIL37807.1 hypothetical protein SD70_30495 [Paenibacillus sp. VKM B-2647]
MRPPPRNPERSHRYSVMKSTDNRSAASRPPEFELPRDAVLPETPRQASEASSGNIASDAAIAEGLTELADKDEYVDEP